MPSVSWCSKGEWEKLSSLVCSIPDEPDNTKKLELTVSILNCLMSRIPSPPIGAQMTSELLQAFLATAKDIDHTASLKSRPHMAFAIIRFVNYVSHAFQEPASFGIKPLHKMAAAQNVPDWLVTLRHDASHGSLPPPQLLRSAMLAALNWTITAYWQEQNNDVKAAETTAATTDLQQLEMTLNGSRGRQLNKNLLITCLSSEALRGRSLKIMAETMITSFSQAKGGQVAVIQSWLSAVSVVCRGDLLTELLESLLVAVPPDSDQRRQTAATLWVEQLVRAVRTASGQLESAEPDRRSPSAAVNQQLSETVGSAGPVCWPRLVETALKHKNASTGRLLPLLLDGLTPPLPERRRRLLLQLVRIATGGEPPARAPVRVGPEELRRLGIRLTATAESPHCATPATPIMEPVAPPAENGSPAWRRCTDGPEWREATEVGRLPWQQETPMLLDRPETS